VLVLGHSSEFMELKSIVQNDKNYNLKQGNMALISRAYNEFQFLNFFSIRKFMLRLKLKGQQIQDIQVVECVILSFRLTILVHQSPPF
jgi:hypothetical protein